MGCPKLNIDFFHFLEIIHSKKKGCAEKKRINYYPFGLKHKGYNNVTSANVNSVASKFKFNGVELEESLGLDLYEMDLRQYDPAIVRFTSIDPVTHFSYSTYTAFDNNPIFWADPSGANGIQYDLQGRVSNVNGRAVSVTDRQERAKKQNSNSPDDFVGAISKNLMEMGLHQNNKHKRIKRRRFVVYKYYCEKS